MAIADGVLSSCTNARRSISAFHSTEPGAGRDGRCQTGMGMGQNLWAYHLLGNKHTSYLKVKLYITFWGKKHPFTFTNHFKGLSVWVPGSWPISKYDKDSFVMMKFCLVAIFTNIFQADLSNRSWFPYFYQHALYTMYYNVIYIYINIIYIHNYIRVHIHTHRQGQIAPLLGCITILVTTFTPVLLLHISSQINHQRTGKVVGGC